MKRINVFGLALTLVLGCWVGSASARPLEAWSALLVPYYEVGGNLATLIGVQHVGAAGEFSIINVTVHKGDDGTVVPDGRSFICLGQGEFGFVALQSPAPTGRDTAQGVFFSVAEDNIDATGFVTLAYGGTRLSCSSGAGTTAANDDNGDVMVAWAVLQDVGDGFFATEIPVVAMDWQASVVAGSGYSAKDAAASAYCYLNTDTSRATVVDQVNTVLNSNPALRCNDALTYTYVPAGRALPAIPASPAIDPSVALSCPTEADCPGLAINVADVDGLSSNGNQRRVIGARFDVISFNKSVSNIYTWLNSAPGPLDIRDGNTLGKTTEVEDLGLLSVVCDDGEETDRDIHDIDISGHVNVINPRSLGCSGRGVLNLKLPRRAAAADYCYPSGEDRAPVVGADGTNADGAQPTVQLNVLDDRNNRCNSFSRAVDDKDTADTADNTYYCYNSTVINSSNPIDDDKTPVPADRVEAAEITNTAGTVTGCKRFTYVPDVTEDDPSGFMFSHISQADAHFRMNFPGYKFSE